MIYDNKIIKRLGLPTQTIYQSSFWYELETLGSKIHFHATTNMKCVNFRQEKIDFFQVH